MWLECPEIVKKARPGQFVMVGCGPDCTLRRPISIHQSNSNGVALFFSVWEDGKGTQWLSRRKPGETIDTIGPLGNGFQINSKSKNLLLVAGGIGIAPLRFLAEDALSRMYLVKMLQGASGEYQSRDKPNPSQLYPKHLLPLKMDALAFRTIECSPDGKSGMVTELLTQKIEGGTETYIDWSDEIFSCGPLPMYKTMSRMPELKNKPVQVSLEVRMACGLGICYGCTVKTRSGLKQVCHDGPVFNLCDVLWDEVVC
ncbi:MAG: dihydroorotate dehydrogenase electron transfer subunit [Dehalococcoidia bacterium]|nr:MAG: dihydroorotate dehydrogenase electron transfer subunit [Dehalococcoidia bacterium]